MLPECPKPDSGWIPFPEYFSVSLVKGDETIGSVLVLIEQGFLTTATYDSSGKFQHAELQEEVRWGENQYTISKEMDGEIFSFTFTLFRCPAGIYIPSEEEAQSDQS